MKNKLNMIFHLARLSNMIYDNKIEINYKDNLVFSKTIDNVLIQILKNEDNSITIIVRGSDNKQNWIDNLKFWKNYDKQLGIYLHNGFKKLNDKIFLEVFKFLKESDYLDYRFYLTGHSQGSVNALLLTLKLDLFGFNIEQFVGFGTPKMTNLDGAMKLSLYKLVRENKIIRVINDKDIVNLLPYSSWLIKLNHGEYRHYADELILLDNNQISINYWDKVITKNKSLLKNIDIHSIQEHKMQSYINKLMKLDFSKTEIIKHTFNL
jgi:hypothetical protein